MSAPRIKVINHYACDAVQYAVEFEGQSKRYPIKADTDAEVDAAVKRAGLWKRGGEYPGFTIYKDGEEIGGGGGSNSGSMDRAHDRAPRVKVFNHRTGDITQSEIAEAQKWFKIQKAADPALNELQAAAGNLPSRLVTRENITEARGGLKIIIRAANKALSALEG